MNKYIPAFIFTVITTAGLGLNQSAQAQAEERGNRFNYAPNLYKNEAPRIPVMPEPHTNVRSGSVPKGLLGADPMFLAPVVHQPAPAPVTQTIANFVPHNFAPALSTSATPKTVEPPKFNKAFGAPPQAQKAPAAGVLPVPQIAKAPTAPAPHHAAPVHPHNPVLVASNHLAGKMINPHVAAGQAAGPAKVLSYSQGYTPGTYLPSIGGGNQSGSADANVHGRLMHKN